MAMAGIKAAVLCGRNSAEKYGQSVCRKETVVIFLLFVLLPLHYYDLCVYKITVNCSFPLKSAV